MAEKFRYQHITAKYMMRLEIQTQLNGMLKRWIKE